MTVHSLPTNRGAEDHADSVEGCSTASTRSQYTETSSEGDVDLSEGTSSPVRRCQPTMAEGWEDVTIRSPSPPTDDDMERECASTSCSERSEGARWGGEEVASCEMDLPTDGESSEYAVTEDEDGPCTMTADTTTTVCIHAMGYADDTYGMGEETATLKQPLEATQKWIVDTGQGVNSNKSVAFSTEDLEEREVLRIGGDGIP